MVRLTKIPFSSAYLSATFWYVALFPGRLPFDSSDAIRMMKNGESTEQWTPLFFWLLRIFTFDGRFIFLASALISISFFYSFNSLAKSIKAPNRGVENRILFWLTITPIYGFWSVTVSHDSTFVIGFIMTISVLLRCILDANETVRKTDVFLAAFFLLTSWIGYILCGILVASLLLLKSRYWLYVITMMIAIMVIAPIGISSTRSDVIFRPFLVDIKCAVQHQEAEVSQQTWQSLLEIAPKEKWLDPVSCASMDGAIQTLSSVSTDLSKLSWGGLLPAYGQLLKDNPAIILVGHFQRSSVALPPLLFQPPKNQVSWNLESPVGLGTNTMIQQGPEVVHPSVDEESVNITIPILDYLEFPAQLLGFLTNQASWFWGWGGLWIICFLAFVHSRFSFLGFPKLKFIYAQVFSFHLLLFALMPDPTPRYVLPSLLLGNFAVIAYFQTRKLETH